MLKPEPSPGPTIQEKGGGGYPIGQALALLAFMVAMTLCLELARLPLVLLVDPVRKSFGVGDVEVSLLLGVFSSAPFVVMSLAGGWLSDRVSRKRLLLAAAATWTAGALLCAFARRYEVLAAGRILVGLGVGMKLPIAMTWINDAFPPARRGRAIGAFFVVLGSGPSLAVILAGAVQEAAQRGALAWLYPLVGAAEPWRATVFLLALPTLVVAPLVLALPDRRAGDGPGRAGVATAASRAGFGLAAWAPAALVVLAAALVAFVDASSLAWVSTLLIRTYGFSPRDAGALFGAATLAAGLAGPLIGGLAGDRAFRRFGPAGRPALAGAAALACAPLMLGYLVDAPAVLVAVLALSGVCTVTGLSLSYVAVQAALPHHARGLGTGAMSAGTTLVGSAGPTAVAVASKALSGGGSLAPAIALVGGAAAVTAGLLLLAAAAAQRASAPRGVGAASA